MDSDYGRSTNIPTKVTPIHSPPPHSLPISSPPAVVESGYKQTSSESPVPYLAKLVAFSLVFLSVLYALSTIIGHLVEKLLVKQSENNYDYSYFSGIDSFLVISAVATLIVALPASALLLFFLRRAENKQSWRLSQKWRRIIYTILQIILITTIISTLIGVVYNIFSHSLGLEIGSSYYGTGEDSKKEDPQTASKIAATIISGLVAIIIFALGIAMFIGEYAAKWRQVAWVVLALFALSGSIVSAVSITKVQEQIAKDKKQNASPGYYNSYPEDPGTGETGSSNSSVAQSDLESVRSDLNYYASSNAGKYPTKAQWDDGSLKPKYFLSSDETLKKVTYTPTCTKMEPPTCFGYTISMKDKDGKTVTLSNTDNSY